MKLNLGPLECNSESYPYSVSFSKFPTNEYWQALLKTNNYTTFELFKMSFEKLFQKYNNNLINSDEINNILKDNVVALNVYYDDLSYTIVEELVKTELSDIISNVGGILGLFSFKFYFML